MIDWIKNVFKKKTKVVDLKDIELGSHVRFYIRDPKAFGIVNVNQSYRYDPDDLEKKYITGTLTNRICVRDLMFLEVGTYKHISGERRERVYTVLSEEIEKIEIL